MDSYLDYLDEQKKQYIEARRQDPSASYIYAQFYFYQDVRFVTKDTILFCQALQAVKLTLTAIVFVSPDGGSRVYFSDEHIRWIIQSMDDDSLKRYLVGYLEKIRSRRKLEPVSFQINGKLFTIEGIPFQEEFNHTLCKNPGDIQMNGNDLIALLNLIFEKERIDTTPDKPAATAAKYLG